MKTNFENAVKILMEGRCNSIRPEGSCTNYALKNETLNYEFGSGINTSASKFLGQWECLGYKPEMETVIVDRMVLVNRETGRIIQDLTEDPAYCRDGRYRETTISIEVKRPVKEKVKRRVEVPITSRLADIHGNIVHESAEYFAEWEE